MGGPSRRTGLSLADEKALRAAVDALEHSNLASRIADLAGEPMNKAFRLLPRFASKRVNRAVERAVLKALNLAIDTLEETPAGTPAMRRSSVIVGVTGGVGGLFGLAGLPFELPLTTTFMLRAIADIARHQGEDLTSLEARLACLEVFALAAQGGKTGMHVGYYASRAFLAKLTSEAATIIVERGVASLAAPAVNSLVSTIVARFGVVVSDRLAAGALPVIGALGGATVNVVFMNHFQRIALGHFTVRRLDRIYGPDVVRTRYAELLEQTTPAKAKSHRLPQARPSAGSSDGRRAS